ncbi:hypothetical protein [Thalassovita aquimarina]|uniref:Uncharacterized protein n=1 Tax=Thalassovita aquimarina TaxID=2785917 RepID=A0ABS5HVM5_9RHOB|nr:hypothetical protein [Thalassovita aquimarina]MBR9652996.1 hypothetical protein [Thalassovita aquimarina]
MNKSVKNLGLTLVTALLGAGATVTAGAMIVGLGSGSGLAQGVVAHAVKVSDVFAVAVW